MRLFFVCLKLSNIKEVNPIFLFHLKFSVICFILNSIRRNMLTDMSMSFYRYNSCFFSMPQLNVQFNQKLTHSLSPKTDRGGLFFGLRFISFRYMRNNAVFYRILRMNSVKRHKTSRAKMSACRQRIIVLCLFCVFFFVYFFVWFLFCFFFVIKAGQS